MGQFGSDDYSYADVGVYTDTPTGHVDITIHTGGITRTYEVQWDTTIATARTEIVEDYGDPALNQYREVTRTPSWGEVLSGVGLPDGVARKVDNSARKSAALGNNQFENVRVPPADAAAAAMMSYVEQTLDPRNYSLLGANCKNYIDEILASGAVRLRP